MPVEACSDMPPLSRCGIPQANSITSSPRVTSPMASESTLPCSAVRIRETSSRRSWTSSRILKSSSARFASDVARQAGKAAFAAATAAPTSSVVARSTSPVCCPSAGLNTGPARPDVPSTALPPIQWVMRVSPSRCWVGEVASSVIVSSSYVPGTGYYPSDMRTLAALTCSATFLFGGSAQGADPGEIRLLVIPLTRGPAVSSRQELQQAVGDADTFFERASFGQASIVGTVTPLVSGFVVPPSCFAGANEDTGLGAVAVSARGAATRLGYDLSAYDRFVYVFPDRVCGSGGLGAGRDVLLAGDIGGLVHELGHTFRLPHASRARCATFLIHDSATTESVMGQ